MLARCLQPTVVDVVAAEGGAVAAGAVGPHRTTAWWTDSNVLQEAEEEADDAPRSSERTQDGQRQLASACSAHTG
eukprot:COSAG02_NODE_582_length_20017_cov_26.599608_13_plen_75_part_00